MLDVKLENLRGVASKASDGSWIAIAYAELKDTRLVMAIKHGKKAKSTIKLAMKQAIELVESGEPLVTMDNERVREVYKENGWRMPE